MFDIHDLSTLKEESNLSALKQTLHKRIAQTIFTKHDLKAFTVIHIEGFLCPKIAGRLDISVR